MSKTAEIDIWKNRGLVWHAINKKYHFKDEEERRDLFQIGCLALCRAKRGYREGLGANFAVYAYRSIQNALANYAMVFPKRQMRTGKECEQDFELFIDKSSVSGEKLHIMRVFADSVIAGSGLNERELFVIIQHYWHEKPFRTIGKEIGMSYESMRNAEKSAIGKMRAFLGLD